MTDSINLKVSVEHIVANEEERNTLPFLLKQTLNNDGEVLSSVPRPQWVESPLTKAKFQVTPVFLNKFARKGELTGYEVSINVPACVIGNNALLQILPYPCGLFALEFLKWYLLNAGCSPEIVQQLDLKHSSNRFLALTVLLECADREEAIDFNRKIQAYGEATLNSKHTNSKQKKPITAWSSSGQTTVTITKPGQFEGKTYVKVGPVPHSFETFHSTEVRKAVYAESSRHVRIEFNACEKWLLKNGGASPLDCKRPALPPAISDFTVLPT